MLNQHSPMLCWLGMKPESSVAVIGAGPAGLTAAYLLAKRSVPVTVLERDPVYVGGIALRYRDFLVVMLILREKNLFRDNWIYIHDPRVKVGRVQNFKSWSPEMVPDPNLCCYGLEYFCFAGDSLWTAPDSELIAMATREIQMIGLADHQEDVLDGRVVRQAKAYPVYDDNYVKHVECVRRELEERFPTFHLVGRNGMHRYNNQDHAMMTAMLTVENILSGKRLFDVWRVNQDAQYLEERSEREAGSCGLRAVPKKLSQPVTPST